MTDFERRSLLPGDRVLVRRDNDDVEERLVKYSPWPLGHGEWVIGLAGIAGGYLLARVESMVSRRWNDGDDAA